MAELIQRLLKLRREGQLKATLIRKGRTQLAIYAMRMGLFTVSLWLTRRDPTCSGWKIGIYRYQSVESWTAVHGEIKQVYPESTVTLNPVRTVGYHSSRASLHQQKHSVVLPAVVINTLRNVEIIGGSEMVFTSEGTVLYDELALGNVNRYGSKTLNIRGDYTALLPAANRRYLQCLYRKAEENKEIPRAISLLKDHSQNYYHWLLECLPRAILALREPEWVDAPLLIDAGFADQLVESLRLLAPARQHITIPQGQRTAVRELCFPSVFSPTHDHYGASPRADDFLVAPQAISLLRESFLPAALQKPGKEKRQYLYVARTGGTHRAIVNEAEVIHALEDLGFDIVYPGNMSFIDQIALFANASIIVGPTGAQMANIAFAKRGCKVAVLAPVTRNANYFLFAQISQHLDQVFSIVGGEPAKPSDLHSSYKVDVDALRNLIAHYIIK